MYQEIRKMLEEGGKCLLIENGKLLGVILTMEEYELLRSKSQNQEGNNGEAATHPIGEVVANEIEFPGVSANIDEINLADAESVTLEDLGLDELSD